MPETKPIFARIVIPCEPVIGDNVRFRPQGDGTWVVEILCMKDSDLVIDPTYRLDLNTPVDP